MALVPHLVVHFSCKGEALDYKSNLLFIAYLIIVIEYKSFSLDLLKSSVYQMPDCKEIMNIILML